MKKGPPPPGFADDSDRDGVKDSTEAAGCIGQIEDFDGFVDNDGCPDPDNDADGLADDVDQCPGVKSDGDPSGCPGIEDAKQLASADPNKDTDGDGLLDSEDGCGDKAEDMDGFEDADGCPDPDNDRDGVLDAADSCASAQEDRRGSKPADGCPASDTDKDGVLDEEEDSRCVRLAGTSRTRGCPDKDGDGITEIGGQDKCPSMSDTSGDGDGCPGTDADGDNIKNNVDQCPDQPETRNLKPEADGRRDADGCPD